MSLMAGIFVALLALGVPIAFVMGIAGSVGLFALGLKPMLIAQRMFNGVDSFILLAAPFYILAGELMSRSGITRRLVRLSMLITGHVRGGTAFGSVLSAIMFSGISGTAVGDTAALGQIFIKEMPREGYKTEYAAALVVAGSMIGPIVPPSVTLVIFSAVSQISVIDLFIAGIIPGLLLAAGVAGVILMHVFTKGLPRSRFSLDGEPVWRVLVEGLLVIMLPVILVGGALSGVFTTTEAGGVAVLYTLLLGMVIFRKLGREEIWQALLVTARISASIYLVLAASEVLSYAMTTAGISAWVRGLGPMFAGHPTLFLLAVVLFAVVAASRGPEAVRPVPAFRKLHRGMS